ncbi:MAG: MFS transporter [Deltaproteobacteria bacterium]|nr:MFS transporter [Deltaproteobacteria bacterium]
MLGPARGSARRGDKRHDQYSGRRVAAPGAVTRGQDQYSGRRVAALGAVAFLTLVPVTLPVSILRAFVADRFDVSELLASLFMSINMVGAVITAPLAGVLSDRIGHRRELLVAGLATDAVLLYALTLPFSFPTFMTLRFFEGCAHIFALSLLLSLASASQTAERRGRVMGMVGGGITLGVAVGAMLGGFLGDADPLRPIRFGAAIAGGGAVVAWWLLPDVDRAGEDRPRIGTIVAVLRANPLLLAPLAFAFVDRFTVGFYTTTFSLYLSGVHGLSPMRIGILIFVFMLPFALFSYPFGRLSERGSPVRMVCLGSLAYGAGTVLVPWWPVDSIFVLMVAVGVASAVMFVPSMILTTQAAPEQIRGTALGAFNAFGSLGFIVGPATGGFVSQHIAETAGWEAGYRAAFGVAGASEALCVVLALPFLIRLTRLGRTR